MSKLLTILLLGSVLTSAVGKLCFAQSPYAISWVHGASPGDEITSLSLAQKAGRVLTTDLSGIWQSWPISSDTVPARDEFDFARGAAFCSVAVKAGTELITGGNGIRAWNISANQFSLICSYTSSVMFIDATSDGNLIAAYTEDNVLHLYDRQTAREMASWQNASGPMVFSRDGKLLLAGMDKKLVLISVEESKIIHEYTTYNIAPFCLAASPLTPGQFAFAWSGGGVVLDTSGIAIAKWPLNTTGATHAMDYSPDGRVIAAGGGDGVYCFSLDDSSSFDILGTQSGELVQFWNQDTIVSSGPLGVSLFSLKTRSYLTTLSAHNNTVRAVTYTSDGSSLLSASQDNTVMVWNAHTGSLRKILAAKFPQFASVAASKYCRVVVAAGSLGELLVWKNLADSALYLTSTRSTCTPSVAFSPSDTLFATASDISNTVTLWSANTFSVIREFAAGSPVAAICFSSDGSKIAAATSNNTCSVWDTRDGHLIDAPLPTTNASKTLFFRSDDSSLTFDIGAALPDGIHSVKVDRENLIYVVNVAFSTIANTIPGLGENLWSVAVNPKTGEIAAGGLHGSVMVWKPLGSAGVQSSPPPSLPLEAHAESGRIEIMAPAERGKANVYRSDGRCFYSSETQVGSASYSTGPLPAGVYFVVFQPERGQRRFAKVSLFGE